MRIIIKTTNLDLTAPLKEYAEEKIGSLSRFLKSFEKEGAVKAVVELGRTTKHHHKGEVFRAEINLSLGINKVLRAEAESRDIRLAIDEVKKKLRQRISKSRI